MLRITFNEGATSIQCLRLGLQGSLIPFAPLAFVPERQSCPRTLPSRLAFLSISTDFTPPPRIPGSPNRLNPSSFPCRSEVKLQDWTKNLPGHRRYALRPVNPDNARTPRITEASGTWLASAFLRGTVKIHPSPQWFTTLRPSSHTRCRCVRLSSIAQDSQLLPPVGVGSVSQ
jgi:hypothetical protein